MTQGKAEIRAAVRAARRARRAAALTGDVASITEAGADRPHLGASTAHPGTHDDLHRTTTRPTTPRDPLLTQWELLRHDFGLAEVSVAALFVPTPSEPDVTALLNSFDRVLLPVLVDAEGHRLDSPAWGIHRPRSAERLVAPAPRWPAQPAGAPLGPEALDLAGVILLPSLAVDASGTRLGQGGGWYDRALPHCSPGTVVVAVLDDASEVLPAGALPREDHDVPVDAALWPTGWRRFRT